MSESVLNIQEPIQLDPKFRPIQLVSDLPPVSFIYSTSISSPLCPDLLSIRNIGEADGWRGWLVRAFFRFLKLVTGV